LHRDHPRVDGAIVIILALVAEGARRRPALDDQVMGLLEAREVLRGVDAAMQALDGGAAHEAGDDAAAGKAIQHGDLLGHAHRVVDGDDVAEDGDLGLLGDLADDGRIDVDRGLHAPVGGMMLIGHDAVEANLIGEGVLFMILVVQDMGLLRVKVRVRKAQPPRIVLGQILIGDVAIGLLREPEYLNAIFHG
jgi:hypothetical protein